MLISALNLTNFRNYKKSRLSFIPSINIIVGKNTAGKTNVLEAVFLCATGKSFRAEKDIELVNLTEEVGRVEVEVLKENQEKTVLEIVLTRGVWGGHRVQVKKYLVNKVAKRQMDFIGNLHAVLFSPKDLELVTDSPSLRRNYLDSVLIQVDREYRRAISLYEKGLRQRNKLLERIRDEGVSRSQLSFWDGLLIKNGNVISGKREEFISFVNYCGSIASGYSGTQKNISLGDFEMQYDQSGISAERLLKYSREEVRAATTLVGPHRDDWRINKKSKNLFVEKEIKNQNAKTGQVFLNIASFGSRGEQRMAVMFLKMAELSYLNNKCAEPPVLLLDDIFSELDQNHRRLILEIIQKQQTIITTTDIDHVAKEFLDKVKLINLD